MASFHSSRARMLTLSVSLALTASTGATAQQSAATARGFSSFTIFFRAQPVGTEQISLERAADGWTISGGGRLGAPFDVVTRSLQVRYGQDWQPLELAMALTARGEVTTLRTTVAGTTATSTMTASGTPAQKVDTVDAAA